MAKQRPKTGERRRTNLPLKIDRLPDPIQQAILVLRNQQGKSWQAIEEQSARPYSKDWEKDGGGFIDWDSLSTEDLEHFPDLKLPHTNLHRWYDLRVRQVHAQKLKEAEFAHEWAEQYAKGSLRGSTEVVVNAMQAEVFNLMQTVSDGDRVMFLKGLNGLALVMTRLRRLELQERAVSVDERRIKQIEKDAELKRRRMENELNAVEKKMRQGKQFGLEDINSIRQRVFGMSPILATEKGGSDVAQG